MSKQSDPKAIYPLNAFGYAELIYGEKVNKNTWGEVQRILGNDIVFLFNGLNGVAFTPIIGEIFMLTTSFGIEVARALKEEFDALHIIGIEYPEGIIYQYDSSEHFEPGSKVLSGEGYVVGLSRSRDTIHVKVVKE